MAKFTKSDWNAVVVNTRTKNVMLKLMASTGVRCDYYVGETNEKGKWVINFKPSLFEMGKRETAHHASYNWFCEYVGLPKKWNKVKAEVASQKYHNAPSVIKSFVAFCEKETRGIKMTNLTALGV